MWNLIGRRNDYDGFKKNWFTCAKECK